MAESIYQESMGVTGLPGVQTSTRLVGTVSGSAPTSGTFSTNDFVVDQTGGFWVCSSGGTPGNWNRVNSNAAVASVNLTAQTAAISPTTLYTTTTSGLFNVSYYAKVTTPAGSSSNLGPFNVISTDPDGNTVTTVGNISSQNSSVSGFISGNATIYVGSGTNIQYSLGYTSSGSPSMAYSLRAIVSSSVIAPSIINAVNSFNGRTGAVTPGSSDYTAAQVGAVSTVSTAGGRNFVINGGLDIWQRGTYTTSTTGAYTTADRWFTTGGGSTTFSQDTDVPSAIGVQYSFKWTTTASSSFGQFYQALEQAVVKPLRGQVVTLSAWCKTVNYGSGNQFLRVNYSNSTDALVSQGTSVQDVVVAGNSLGSWTRITSTFTVPTDAVGLAIEFIPDTAQASGVTFKMTGVQLEIGSTATAFSRAGGTIQGELAACQRYYYQTSANASNTPIGSGWSTSSTGFTFNWQLPVPLRVAPSSVGSNSTSSGYYIYQGGAFINCNSISGILSSASYTNMALYVTTSGLTTGYGGMFFANSSSAYLYASAEL